MARTEASKEGARCHGNSESARVGSGPLSYQWTFGGANLVGATAATLVLPNVPPPEAGSYAVAATNVAGAATSAVASLRVLVPPTPGGVSTTGKRLRSR